MKNPDIYIFYHLFTLPGWVKLWRYHLRVLLQSQLYNECKEINVCVVYQKSKDLNILIQEIEKYSKIKIYSKREYDSLPIKIWDNPDISIDTQLGEGETILKMIDFANTKENDIYLFFHSKSITVPKKEQRRSQMKYFYSLGLKRNCTPKERMIFIRNEMANNTIGEWEWIVRNLKIKDFYYCVWNFFWANGSFLRKFNFKEFDSKGILPQHYTLNDRHWSALFPVTLYQVINNKKKYTLKGIRTAFKCYY